MFTISVELYETMSGKLLSSIVFESENISGLLGVIRSEAKPLFQSILDLKALSIGLKDNHPADSSKSLNQANQVSDKGGMKMPQWLGIGLAVAGIGAGVYGILQNNEYDNLYNDYQNTANFGKKWKDVENAKGRRNIGYIIGSALLASGVTVYFVF
jgi:oligoendopeptidase F